MQAWINICKKALESQILIDKVLLIFSLGCWYRNWKRSSGWTGESWLPLSSQCWWPWSLLSTFPSTKWCRTTDAWSRTPSTGCPAGKGLRTVPTWLSWAAVTTGNARSDSLTLHTLPLRTSFFTNWWETLRWRKTQLWQIYTSFLSQSRWRLRCWYVVNVLKLDATDLPVGAADLQAARHQSYKSLRGQPPLPPLCQSHKPWKPTWVHSHSAFFYRPAATRKRTP